MVSRIDRHLALVRAMLTRSFDGEMLDGGNPVERAEGKDWPATAETMLGPVRLAHLEDCCRTVLQVGEHVPGDFCEAGVWRGGAAILMRAVLDAYDANRRVWLCDTFAGLPPVDRERWPAEGADMSDCADLAVSLAVVQANMARYGYGDDSAVRYVEGLFADTLPGPIRRLAVLRVDADYYSSTMQALQALEPLVSAGGFVIVDDYGAFDACRRAVEDYRAAAGIDDPIDKVDWTAVSWRVTR